MVDFQAFVATIKVKDDLPDVSATGIPLSVIIAAHHNLVTYGVPFVNKDGVWTNPGPQKTFYVPEEVISMITTRLDIMSNDQTIQKWLRTNPTLDGGDVPGMAKWVKFMKAGLYDLPWEVEKQKQWVEFHEFSNEWGKKTSEAWAEAAKNHTNIAQKQLVEVQEQREVLEKT